MATNTYQPYSTVENSYNRFMGVNSGIPATPSNPVPGPIQYNTGLSNLRAVGDSTNINGMGSGSPEDRITNRAQKMYEKWEAGNQFRQRAFDQFQSEKADALGGLQGVNYNNYMRDPTAGGGYGQGSSGLAQTSYGQFMSGQGAAGLLGGSTSTPGQRYSSWNDKISTQAQAYQQAMAPLYAKYRTRQPNTSFQALW